LGHGGAIGRLLSNQYLGVLLKLLLKCSKLFPKLVCLPLPLLGKLRQRSANLLLSM
jgi:hypothetical protein